MGTRVADNPEKSRYEIHADDGQLAGVSLYRLRGDRISFTHTEIDDAFEGQGLGSELVRRALDDVRERGLAVLPFCPFVKAWIGRHLEYADLVPEPERFGLGDA